MQWNQQYDQVGVPQAVAPREAGQSVDAVEVEALDVGSDFDHLSLREPEEENKQLEVPAIGAAAKGSFHTSQFDSKASDYFLLLNQKNHNVVKKRRSI